MVIGHRPSAPVEVRIPPRGGRAPLSVPLAPADDPLSVLRTRRLVLRSLGAPDADEFLRVHRLNREWLDRFIPLTRKGESDPELFARQVRLSSCSGLEIPDWRRFAFTSGGRLVGGFNLNAIRRGLEFRAETTFWINRECERQGFASEGLGAVIDLAFRAIPHGLGLTRLTAFVDPENAACRRLLADFGFRASVPPVRVSLDFGGRWRPHEQVSLYAPFAGAPAVDPVHLPEPMRLRMWEVLSLIEAADPPGAVHPAPGHGGTAR
ncbi:MAG: GNAT family N-acetyltransferase [Phycisphaerae bacterium]|nr:GNAT family N-acetyltransferase [Phycisphaerae bacterium]